MRQAACVAKRQEASWRVQCAARGGCSDICTVCCPRNRRRSVGNDWGTLRSLLCVSSTMGRLLCRWRTQWNWRTAYCVKNWLFAVFRPQIRCCYRCSSDSLVAFGLKISYRNRRWVTSVSLQLETEDVVRWPVTVCWKWRQEHRAAAGNRGGKGGLVPRITNLLIRFRRKVSRPGRFTTIPTGQNAVWHCKFITSHLTR